MLNIINHMKQYPWNLEFIKKCMHNQTLSMIPNDDIHEMDKGSTLISFGFLIRFFLLILIYILKFIDKNSEFTLEHIAQFFKDYGLIILFVLIFYALLSGYYNKLANTNMYSEKNPKRYVIALGLLGVILLESIITLFYFLGNVSTYFWAFFGIISIFLTLFGIIRFMIGALDFVSYTTYKGSHDNRDSVDYI